eukprot:scpid104629/ scgid3562/ TNF receptor-associated factor 5; RING finger protein 84
MSCFEKQCRAFEEEWFTFGSDIHLLREVKGKSLKVNALTVLGLLFSCFLLFSGLDPRCPQDHQPIGDAFPDRHCERDIACIPVRCGNLTNCTWRGMLKDLEEHRRGCAFEKVACTNAGCGQTVERRHHTEHVTKTCPHSHATVTCQYCNQSIPTHQQTVRDWWKQGIDVGRTVCSEARY